MKKKCSGDAGDGKACTACKSTGRQRRCVFARPETWILATDMVSSSDESTRSSPSSQQSTLSFREPVTAAEPSHPHPNPQMFEQWHVLQRRQTTRHEAIWMPRPVSDTTVTPSMNILTSSLPFRQRQLPPGRTDPVYYQSQARINVPDIHAASGHRYYPLQDANSNQSNTLPPF